MNLPVAAAATRGCGCTPAAVACALSPWRDCRDPGRRPVAGVPQPGGLEGTGHGRCRYSINVSAKVTARVSALLVAEGEQVDKQGRYCSTGQPEIAAKKRQARSRARGRAGAGGQRPRKARARGGHPRSGGQLAARASKAGHELARSTFQRFSGAAACRWRVAGNSATRPVMKRRSIRRTAGARSARFSRT